MIASNNNQPADRAGVLTETWLDDLNGLLARFSGLGIGADIAAMGLCELWGVYCLLRRLAES